MRGDRSRPAFLRAILFCMKKYLLVALSSGLFFNSVYACGTQQSFFSPLVDFFGSNFLGYVLVSLFISCGVVLTYILLKRLREFRFSKIVLWICLAVVSFDLFFIFMVFSQTPNNTICIDTADKNLDVKNIVIPELNFNRATSTTP